LSSGFKSKIILYSVGVIFLWLPFPEAAFRAHLVDIEREHNNFKIRVQEQEDVIKSKDCDIARLEKKIRNLERAHESLTRKTNSLERAKNSLEREVVHIIFIPVINILSVLLEIFVKM